MTKKPFVEAPVRRRSRIVPTTTINIIRAEEDRNDDIAGILSHLILLIASRIVEVDSESVHSELKDDLNLSNEISSPQTPIPILMPCEKQDIPFVLLPLRQLEAQSKVSV